MSDLDAEEPLAWVYSRHYTLPSKAAAFILGVRINRFGFHLDQAVLIDGSVVADAPDEALADYVGASVHRRLAETLLSCIADNSVPAAPSMVDTSIKAFNDTVEAAAQRVREEIDSEEFAEAWHDGLVRRREIERMRYNGRTEEGLRNDTEAALRERCEVWSWPVRNALHESARGALPEAIRPLLELGRDCDQGLCPPDTWALSATRQTERCRGGGSVRGSRGVIAAGQSEPVPATLLWCDQGLDPASLWASARGTVAEKTARVRHEGELRAVRFADAVDIDRVLAYASRRPGDLTPALTWRGLVTRAALKARVDTLLLCSEFWEKFESGPVPRTIWIAEMDIVTTEILEKLGLPEGFSPLDPRLDLVHMEGRIKAIRISDNSRVIFDGQPFKVSLQHAVLFDELGRLANANQKPRISRKTLMDRNPGVYPRKATCDGICAGLPPALRNLIDIRTGRGNGIFLVLPDSTASGDRLPA